MIIIPAIDIRGGRCVRLAQGDYAAETVYDDDPVRIAVRFATAGAARVHVVDLDAARGKPDKKTLAAAQAVVSALVERGVGVEIGGGIRTAAMAAKWLEAGATAVVLGSIAVTKPALAQQICEDNPAAVLLGLDVHHGEARAEGWTEPAGDADEHLRNWTAWPVAGVVRTDVSRDGMLRGPDVDGLAACIAATQHPVIASGGITSLADLDTCMAAGAAGAIIGRALYEGHIGLREAIAAFPARELASSRAE